MKIGIFDSGIGGLSVLHQAMKLLPDQQYIYYADEQHVPYGEKTNQEVLGYVDEIIEFMINKGAQVIVIACNTATSVAAKAMREKYSVPIIGMEPAVKKAIDTYGDKHRVLVIATPITVKGKKIMELVERVDKHNLVDLVALPQLVRFAERQEFDSEEVYNYLKEELNQYPLDQYHSIVLGCTHFNYFKDTLRELLPEQVKFVDGNLGTINHLKEFITSSSNYNVEYYYSTNKPVSPKELDKINTYLQRLEQMDKIM